MQKIRTALLSYGMSGKVFHAPFISFHPGFELIGSWERSKKLIREDYPSVKSYFQIDALLEDDVDLVIVNTPVETHYEYAKKVLLAGKHAIVEKAFTTTVAQAQELAALAKACDAQAIICLGDNFHDIGGEGRLDLDLGGSCRAGGPDVGARHPLDDRPRLGDGDPHRAVRLSPRPHPRQPARPDT